MPVSQRAKQFLPFSALQGLAEALSEQEKILVPMAELSEDMQEELMDRFGEPPNTVMNLLLIAYLKALGHSVYVTEVKQWGKEVKVIMFHQVKLNEGINGLRTKYGRKLQILKGDKKGFVLAVEKKQVNDVEEFLMDLRDVVYIEE